MGCTKGLGGIGWEWANRRPDALRFTSTLDKQVRNPGWGSSVWVLLPPGDLNKFDFPNGYVLLLDPAPPGTFTVELVWQPALLISNEVKEKLFQVCQKRAWGACHVKAEPSEPRSQTAPTDRRQGVALAGNGRRNAPTSAVLPLLGAERDETSPAIAGLTTAAPCSW